MCIRDRFQTVYCIKARACPGFYTVDEAGFYFFSESTGSPKNYMDILLYRGNAGNTELFNQHFGDIGTKEAGKSRSQMDVLDA